MDLGRYGNVLKTLHHSIRLRNRSPVTFATITDNALKEVYYHVRPLPLPPFLCVCVCVSAPPPCSTA